MEDNLTNKIEFSLVGCVATSHVKLDWQTRSAWSSNFLAHV